MFGRGILVFLLVVLFAGTAHASSWIVERVTKNVSYSSDGTRWQTARVGDAIPNAYWVRTGPRARLLLAKGPERIMYRENTLAAISVSQPRGEKTEVTQRRGSILLSLQKRRNQNTSVVTPHLAAVVKGTVFEVTVGRTQSDVRVDRGRVRVSDGEHSVDVRTGRTAAVSAPGAGVNVAPASETSITSDGRVGVGLSQVRGNSANAITATRNRNATVPNSNGARNNGGGNGNNNGGGNGNSNGGGNGNNNGGGGNGNSNGGGNGNNNGGGNGNSNGGGNGNSNGGGN